jgi:hypothetical protein
MAKLREAPVVIAEVLASIGLVDDPTVALHRLRRTIKYIRRSNAAPLTVTFVLPSVSNLGTSSSGILS